ncbi:MAG: DNA primase noncatalytic subunit PriX [Sulfolobales archaeon]
MYKPKPRFKEFLGFIREYFAGTMGQAEYREIFISRGDPKTSKTKSRDLVWIHGLENYLTAFVKTTRELREWNIYMGVGYSTQYELSPNNMLYDRLAFDFDSEEDPDKAVNQALEFSKSIEAEYRATPVVYVTGFKGAHVVIPLTTPTTWDMYKLLWKTLLDRHVKERKLVDTNMLQWNRVDRVPLTYNVKDAGVRYCGVVYPKEFTWSTFKWKDLSGLDPLRVRVVRVRTPEVVKPKLVHTQPRSRSWVWRIVGNGLGDGRKRFMFMVLIPYLASIGKDEKEIVDICLEFIRNSCEKHGRCDKVYESWIRGVIRSSRSSGFRGFSLRTLSEKDPDLYERIRTTLL